VLSDRLKKKEFMLSMPSRMLIILSSLLMLCLLLLVVSSVVPDTLLLPSWAVVGVSVSVVVVGAEEDSTFSRDSFP
jgi:hypothetical protein